MKKQNDFKETIATWRGIVLAVGVGLIFWFVVFSAVYGYVNYRHPPQVRGCLPGYELRNNVCYRN